MKHSVRTTPIKQLGEAVAIIRGIGHSAVARAGTVPVYSIRALREGLDPVGFVDLPTPRYGEDHVVRPGDVLLSLDNPGTRNTLLLDETVPRCTVTQQIVMLRTPDRSVLDPTFLFGWICGPSFQGDLARFSSGTAMQRVPLDAVLRLPIPIPPLEEQHRIGARLHQLEIATDIHRRTAAQIARLRDVELSEMSALFAGEGMV